MHLTPGRARGFTLIELLMCVAILAVLLTLAVPSYATLIGRSKNQAARAELTAALSLARMAAVSRGSHVIVCPSDNNDQCSSTTQWQHGWIVFVDLNHDGSRSPSDAVLAVAQAQSPSVAILGTSGRVHVDYQPDGSAVGTNQTLTVCDRVGGVRDATSIVINQAGRVRRGSPSPASAAACLLAAS